MKFRQGFVSNSSSSSFAILYKECIEDDSDMIMEYLRNFTENTPDCLLLIDSGETISTIVTSETVDECIKKLEEDEYREPYALYKDYRTVDTITEKDVGYSVAVIDSEYFLDDIRYL